MSDTIILLVGSNQVENAELIEWLEEGLMQVEVAEDGATAVQMMEARLPDLVLCDQNLSGFSAKQLCDYVTDFVSEDLPVVVLVDSSGDNSEQILSNLGATALMVRPMQKQIILTLQSLMSAYSQLRAKGAQLKAENDELRKLLQKRLHPEASQHLYSFDTFKKMLVLEIKRARRYDYSVSIVLLCLDNYEHLAGWLIPKHRQRLFQTLGEVVAESIRNVDMPLLFDDNKILLVLPHTLLMNAVIVADRIREKIGRIEPPKTLTQLKVSASAAVATSEGSRDVSFGKMMQQAMRGLEEARLKGGNLVIVCRPPNSKPEKTLVDELPEPNRSRIFFA